jgi:hypothetical protein
MALQMKAHSLISHPLSIPNGASEWCIMNYALSSDCLCTLPFRGGMGRGFHKLTL